MSIGYTVSWIALVLSISFLLAVSAFAQPTKGELGGWAKVQKDHLSDGAICDQIAVSK